MLDIIFIFDIVISVGAAVGSILLLHQILKVYDIQWIKTYQYYLILATVYGIYAITGTIFIKNLLELLEVNQNKIDTISLVFPLLGIPVIFTGWYLLIKMCFEIIDKQPKPVFTILYFAILILFFLLYGIKITSFARESVESLQQFVKSFKLIIIGIKLVCMLIAFLPLFFNLKKIDKRFNIQLIFSFTSIYFIGHLFILALFYLIDFHIILVFLFIFLYFSTELLPVALIYKYVKKNNHLFIIPKTYSRNWNDFLDKYQISKRESEIIEQICLGKSNKEISECLFITLQTVKDHIHNVFIKTDIKNRVQLNNLASKYFE